MGYTSGLMLLRALEEIENLGFESSRNYGSNDGTVTLEYRKGRQTLRVKLPLDLRTIYLVEVEGVKGKERNALKRSLRLKN